MQQRVLIIKIAALGDIICALPLAAEIKRRNPKAHITWLVGRSGRPLLERFMAAQPLVDQIIEIDDEKLMSGNKLAQFWVTAKTWLKLRRFSFDQVFNLHLDQRYWLFLWGRSGFSCAQFRPIAGRHISENFLFLLDAERGPQLSPMRPYFLDCGQTQTNWIGLAPGGAKNIARDNPIRRWPIEHYREVAKALLAEGHPVTILGAKSDEWVREHFAGLNVQFEIGTFSISQFLDRLASLRLLLTHDSGPLHMAAVVGTPLFAIFGSTSAKTVCPDTNGGQVFELTPKLRCQPCFDGKEFANCSDYQCLKQVTPSVVLKGLRAFLQR